MTLSRRVGVLSLVAGALPLAGCYTTRHVESAPEPGTTVVLDLNDRARFELGDRIGPGATSIEGLVENATDTSYVLHVTSVQYMSGQINQWSGEQLRIPATLVSQAYYHQFSRSRTAVLGLGIGAALLSAILRTSFLHFGGGSVLGDPPIGSGTS